MKPLWISVFFLCIISFFGLFAVQTSWKNAISSQWEADQSLAHSMIEFRDQMNAIESSNSRMNKIRTAILAAPLATVFSPEYIAALKAALTAESVMQKFRLTSWELKKGVSLLSQTDLPDLPWMIDPPDPIGERPLRRIGETNHFYGTSQRKQRRAHVIVYKKEDSLWHARFGARPSTI